MLCVVWCVYLVCLYGTGMGDSEQLTRTPCALPAPRLPWGPLQVLFATPGMLHAGLSLFVFKKWAPNPKNMVILPGYCVAGTVGAKVLQGKKKIEMEGGTMIDVNLSVEHLSFSAHAGTAIRSIFLWVAANPIPFARLHVRRTPTRALGTCR